MKTGFSFLAAILFAVSSVLGQAQPEFKGAFSFNDNDTKHILIFSDGYYVHSAYDEKNKQFKNSEGGLFKIENKTIFIKVEFDTRHKEFVDSIFKYPITVAKDYLEVVHEGATLKFNRIDEGTGALAGNWKISGRQVQGKFEPMPTGSRKTIKVLSGTRFQWIAIDPAAKEFFGTGGGTYTFANGKYTEKIEFFPRDNTRVGSSLTFDDRVEENEWYHTGKSSAGAALFEVWKREERP